MEVIWSPQAKKRYAELLEYLEKEWSVETAIEFNERLLHIVSLLKDNPQMGMTSSRRKLYKIIITNQNGMLYRYKPRKKQLVITRLFNTRQDPDKLNF